MLLQGLAVQIPGQLLREGGRFHVRRRIRGQQLRVEQRLHDQLMLGALGEIASLVDGQDDQQLAAAASAAADRRRGRVRPHQRRGGGGRLRHDLF